MEHVLGLDVRVLRDSAVKLSTFDRVQNEYSVGEAMFEKGTACSKNKHGGEIVELRRRHTTTPISYNVSFSRR